MGPPAGGPTLAEESAAVSRDPLFPPATPLVALPARNPARASAARDSTRPEPQNTAEPRARIVRNLSGEQAIRSISADELDLSLPSGAGPEDGTDLDLRPRSGQEQFSIDKTTPNGSVGNSRRYITGRATQQIPGVGYGGLGSSDMANVRAGGNPAPKSKTGLLKRLRNALRGSAQATRAREGRKAAGSETASQLKAGQAAASGDDASSAQASSAFGGTNGRANAASQTPRAKTFTSRQGFSSSRALGSQRAASATSAMGPDAEAQTSPEVFEGPASFVERDDMDPALYHAPQQPPEQPQKQPAPSKSRRFLGRAGLGTSGTSGAVKIGGEDPAPGQQTQQGRHAASASQPISVAAADASVLQQAQADALHPSQSTGNIHRSLPKTRVFSSPPSFSFGFGSRKRLSVSNAKANGNGFGESPANQGTALADSLSEADSGALNRLNRPFLNRGNTDSGRGSGSLNLVNPPKPNEANMQAAPDRNAAALKTILTAVMSGSAPFTKLLDAMYVLEERLPPDTKDMLIKFLSKPDNMTALIDNLTVVVPVISEDEGVLGPGGERATFRYSYVCSMLLSNGPIQLRRSLFLSPKHLDRLVGVLGHGTPTEPVVVRSVCKVLLSVLRDSPEDTVRAMVRRSDFLDALLSHISVTGCPEVCLSMLSTVRCQAELKFGPPNKPIVGVMADANLLQTLCSKLSAAALTNPVDSAASSAIENCSRVIVGIALRALVIPRFDVNDDESDTEYMTKFNRDLASLDVFHQPDPILRLLDAGFEALATHDERGYALSTALTAVRYLMVTAINGQDSSLSAIRMQLLTVNIGAYEAGIRQRIPRLAQVLKTARKGCQVQTMWKRVDSPLGVVRLKILELIVVLLQHGGHETAQAMVDARIPRILMQLFARLELNSLLQHFVATIVEHAFRIASPALRQAFLIDINLIDGIMQLWAESKAREAGREATPVNNLGELSRMANTIREYLVNTSSSEVQRMSVHLGQERLDLFARFCEGPISEHDGENGQLLGGVDRLPPRLDDDGGFGDGSGSIFFRPRTGGTNVD